MDFNIKKESKEGRKEEKNERLVYSSITSGWWNEIQQNGMQVASLEKKLSIIRSIGLCHGPNEGRVINPNI